MRDQLIGYLMVGIVVVFKPDPKYTNAPTVGIIHCITDGATPKPQFTVDVVLGHVTHLLLSMITRCLSL